MSVLLTLANVAGLTLILDALRLVRGERTSWGAWLRSRRGGTADTWPDLLRLHLAGLQPLWVSGLALLMMFLIGKLFVLDERTYAWTQHVTLGTVYPALVMILALLSRSSRLSLGVTQTKLILAVLGMLIAAPFLIKHAGSVVLMGFLLQWFLLFTLSRFGTAGQTAAAVGQTEGAADMPAGTLSMYFAVAFVSLACWTVASRFLWWAPFESWLFSSASAPITLVVSLLLVLVALYGRSPFAFVRESYPVVHKLTTALCLLILAGLGFRTDLLFFLDDARAYSSYLHWSMFVGPAELVRQGGWLLWDVPSHYGFLNTLVVAAMPVQSAWQAMHLVNGFLLACSGALVFFLLRSVGDGFANTLLALAAAVAAVFLLPGLANDPYVLMGPYVFPSYGAYRFFWGYALVAIVVWDFLQPSQKRPRYLVYGVGCMTWLVGSYWSFESAIFCVTIWLPAFACMVLRDALRAATPRSVVLQTASWLAVPMVLMVLSLAVITVYYKAYLGHAPDWYAFYEYALAYKRGYSFVAIDTEGPVWFLFASFCIVSTAAAYALEQKAVVRLSALGAAWTLLWVLASYLAVRGRNDICTTFSPVVCTAVAVVLLVIARHQNSDDWVRLARASLVPLLTVLLTMGLGDFKKLPWASPSAMFQPIEGLRPQVEEPVTQVLRKAGVNAQHPLAYAVHGGDLLRIVPAAGDGTGPITATRAWLPWNPWHATDHLPEERKAVYTARFIQRARSGGWLLLPTGLAEREYLAWLFRRLEQTHTRTAVIHGEGFELFRFEFKGLE